jgi:hypothetical protein
MKYLNEREKEKEEQSGDCSSSADSLKTAPSSAGSPILSRTNSPPARIKVPYALHYTHLGFRICNRSRTFFRAVIKFISEDIKRLPALGLRRCRMKSSAREKLPHLNPFLTNKSSGGELIVFPVTALFAGDLFFIVQRVLGIFAIAQTAKYR